MLQEPNATPAVRHGLEAEDPNETEDPNSVSPAQFKARPRRVDRNSFTELPICQGQISVVCLFPMKLIVRLRFETYLFLTCQESRNLQELVEELKALDS